MTSEAAAMAANLLDVVEREKIEIPKEDLHALIEIKKEERNEEEIKNILSSMENQPWYVKIKNAFTTATSTSKLADQTKRLARFRHVPYHYSKKKKNENDQPHDSEEAGEEHLEYLGYLFNSKDSQTQTKTGNKSPITSPYYDYHFTLSHPKNPPKSVMDDRKLSVLRTRQLLRILRRSLGHCRRKAKIKHNGYFSEKEMKEIESRKDELEVFGKNYGVNYVIKSLQDTVKDESMIEG